MRPIALLALLLWLVASATLAADTGVITRGTQLLDKPSLAGKVLGELQAGEGVEVLQRQGLWFEVKAAPGPGWVRFSRVRVTESVSSGTETQSGSSGNVLASLSRSATGLFGYGNRQAQAGGSIGTVGIRGLSAGDLQTARPDPRQLQRLDGYRSSPDAARVFARAASLSAEDVAYLGDPGGSGGGGGGFSLSLPSTSKPSSSSALKE